MAYYKPCPYCGANLDPGEKCDCEIRRREESMSISKLIHVEKETGQLAFTGGNYEKTVNY